MKSRHKKPVVALLFRRPGPVGYFSIERSFSSIWNALNKHSKLDLQRITAHRVSKGIWPRIQILIQMARLKAGVFHITGDIHFIALVTPKKSTVLTVHDCGFLNHPNPIARIILEYFWLKWPVSRSRFITTVSTATKAAIVRHTGCKSAKIKVIPSAILPHFQAKPRPFNQSRPRILHIGSGKNKNLIRHIESLRHIPCTLHIVARKDPKAQMLLDNYAMDYEWASSLSDQAILSAYKNCDMLLFASTLEGFGMPILEAQSVGRPVVTSNCSSMPEVAGTAAVLVDPLNIASIREGVNKIIRDKTLRENLVQLGFKNITRFQPQTIANAYLDLYHKTLRYS